MIEKDSSSGAPSGGGFRDTLSTQPTVFVPGEDKLTEQELRALSPQDMLWRHRSTQSLSQALIMMVDDEILNIEMTQAFLMDAGYRHFVNTDQPENALDMMRKAVPGVLLLDLSMPKVSGLEILAAMRDDSALRHVPVIVLTSSTDPQVKLKALALGAMDFLSKPVDPSELGLRIRNTLTANAYREYLGQHDALTGLPNKQRYRKMAAEVLSQAKAAGSAGALLHIGVDALGRINDALGRVVGDQLLQRIAKRLASCVQTEAGGELASEQQNPTLYRFDGDEFAVIVPYMEGVHSAAAFISKLLEEATVSFQRQGSPEVFVTSSIGVSVFPNDGMDADVLIRNAGLALRHAKQAGTNRYEFFSPRFNEQAMSRLDLSAELRHCISRDEIELMYQPRVELASGRVVAAQAIVRWKHSSGRIIEGDELMDLAGQTDMDVAITEWLFDQLHKHVKHWKSAGLQPVPTGIKVSLANMHPRDLGYLVSAAVNSGIELNMLSLELQHVTALENLPPREAAHLPGLRKKGVRIALDRFGATASVGHLRKLMCDEIKIDASFMADLEKDAAVQAMLLGMGDLARRLRVNCVACGVDTAQQLAFLRRNNWDQAQGRVLGEPLSDLNFAAKWLTRSGKPLRVPLPGDGT
ncbi:putative bifunctional diguanylate cyclase/phosphodiesterase [Ramlibacter pallidus]|uniref:EAL domain-containing protein n=1 Tax=Ramlibacter pallidus TaxID=2780087 RepID=A0ABR9S4Q0_9BURK|nr:EAL domain-containing protein [Ramlibacter pallidus]MBE7368487.1 EAL domain-containing protein [Ramlibacter pallidus]